MSMRSVYTCTLKDGVTLGIAFDLVAIKDDKIVGKLLQQLEQRWCPWSEGVSG